MNDGVTNRPREREVEWNFLFGQIERREYSRRDKNPAIHGGDNLQRQHKRGKNLTKEVIVMNQKGFTLIELIMVILILGILAVVSVPQFANLQNRARDSAEQGVIGGIRSGITTAFVNAVPPAYPATLDAVPNATDCGPGANACFVTVLSQGGITDNTDATNQWRKLTATTYQHTGTNVSTYTYTPATGAFLCTTNCP